jgi:hypothetical protein
MSMRSGNRHIGVSSWTTVSDRQEVRLKLPHKWPGRKALYVIQAQTRVLGIPDMPCNPVYELGGVTYQLYRNLSRKQQKEGWTAYKNFVEYQMKNQQE